MSTSAVPGVIAWPLIAFMALVLAGRLRWSNSNLYEKYFNSTLAFLLAAQILREHVVQNILVKTSFMTMAGAWQLAAAVLCYSYTEFIGFTLLWSGNSEAETRRKQSYYRAIGVLLVIAMLVAGTSARIAGEPFEFTVGWHAAVNLSCFSAMLMVLSARIIWNSCRELRAASRRRERLIAICTMSMGLTAVVTVGKETALQISDYLGWSHTAEYRLQYHAWGILFMIVGVFATAAVPLAVKLISSLGLNPSSRNWRELQPLRQALRTVVPECAFDLADDEPRRRKSELQLHHTVVEIRDAILRLRPYFHEIPHHDLIRFLDVPNGVPARDHNAAVAALHLAYAARAKAHGSAPDPLDIDSAPIVASRAATLEDEAAELVALAKWWPAASAATEDITETAPTRERARQDDPANHHAGPASPLPAASPR
ncbi:MAG: MAB_1171c family putative transporter [Actinomycetota bacterium]|nr:MAB_1171c family putative transporter [Actinomycetota bacterium]